MDGEGGSRERKGEARAKRGEGGERWEGGMVGGKKGDGWRRYPPKEILRLTFALIASCGTRIGA